MGKPFWQSKTFWFNFVALVAALAATLGLDLGLTAEVQAQIVAGVMGVVNVALRFMTREPVRMK